MATGEENDTAQASIDEWAWHDELAISSASEVDRCQAEPRIQLHAADNGLQEMASIPLTMAVAMTAQAAVHASRTWGVKDSPSSCSKVESSAAPITSKWSGQTP